MRRRGDPDEGVVTPGEERRKPDLHPGPPRRAGAGHDELLLGAHEDPARTGVRHRDGTLEPAGASEPYLGGLKGEVLVEGLGHLEEQLVHRHGTREMAAEGAKDARGRLAFPVDDVLGIAGEDRADRHPEDRRHGGGQHGEAEDEVVTAGHRRSVADDDENVDGDDHRREAGEKDRDREQPLHAVLHPAGSSKEDRCRVGERRHFEHERQGRRPTPEQAEPDSDEEDDDLEQCGAAEPLHAATFQPDGERVAADGGADPEGEDEERLEAERPQM